MTIQDSKPVDTIEKNKSIIDTDAIAKIKSVSVNLKTTLSVADSLSIENTVQQFFNRYKNRMEKITTPDLSDATSTHQEEYTLLLKEWKTFSGQFEPQSSGSVSSQRIYQNALYRYNLEIGKLNSILIK
jgi:hypothetical protein